MNRLARQTANVNEGPAVEQSEAEIYGRLAPLMRGKSERELMALADRLEGFNRGLRVAK